MSDRIEILRRQLETALAEEAAVAWRWLATFETHDMGTHLKLVMSEQKHEQR